MIVIYVLAVAICIVRFTVTPHKVSLVGSYQALAHLFVGGLIGAWLANTQANKIFLYVAIAMSIVEITAVVIGRLTKDSDA